MIERDANPTRAWSMRTLLAASVVVLGACSWMPFIGSDDEDRPEEIETSEQRVYSQAQRALRTSNYTLAIQTLEQLEARFPFGRYAEQAQLELIYARYMSFRQEEAQASAERFIRLHPQHANVDYAYYIKGLSAFTQNQNLLDRFFETDIFKRDMGPANSAYADFGVLLARFPDSQYAPDARQRMVYLRNILARSELAIADYYLRRGAHIAAANRARYVLETYPNAEATPDALVVLVECNWKLDLKDEANNALRVLALNYPNFQAFDENGNLVLDERIRNRDRSWANLMTFGLLDRPEVPPPLKIEHPEGFVPPPIQPRDERDGTKEKCKKWCWVPFIG
jgi:outer membrane protein assembly factor BamD